MYITMKTINKSKLMKRAWSIFYGSLDRDTLSYDMTFAESLKNAWAFEKREANFKPAERKQIDVFQLLADAMKPQIHTTGISQQGYDQFYSNTRYFGD